MKADREKRAIILTAEGQRESAIRSAEGQKQAQILTAEGRKQAAILEAEADRQSRILRAQGDRAAQYLQAQGEAKAIEKVFAAIKAGRPTPELLAYQYLQTLPEMAKGEANKVWMVPSDFGKALEGFTRMLGAPGEDGVFRFQPSPVDDVPAARPEDDDESVRDWFDTATDPELARVVANAEAQARQAVPPIGVPDPQVPASAWPPPQQLPPGAAPAVEPPRPRPAAAPTTPLADGEPESAQPTPPRGMPRNPAESGNGHGGRAGRRAPGAGPGVRRPAAAGLPLPAAARLTARQRVQGFRENPNGSSRRWRASSAGSASRSRVGPSATTTPSSRTTLRGHSCSA